MDMHAALRRFSWPASSGSKGINTWHLCWEGHTLLSQRPLTTPPANLQIVNMLYKIFAILALAVTYVTAEKHVVTFDNR